MARRTILLIGELEHRYEEARVKATKTITPGMLIEQTSDGTYQPHGTAGATFAEVLVAHEDALQARTIDDDYAEGELVRFHIAQSGDVLYMFLAAGETAVVNSPLSSNGDGSLQVAAGVEGVQLRAQEALDLSGMGAVKTRLAVRRV